MRGTSAPIFIAWFSVNPIPLMCDFRRYLPEDSSGKTLWALGADVDGVELMVERRDCDAVGVSNGRNAASCFVATLRYFQLFILHVVLPSRRSR
jgi:hypothetical protein